MIEMKDIDNEKLISLIEKTYDIIESKELTIVSIEMEIKDLKEKVYILERQKRARGI